MQRSNLLLVSLLMTGVISGCTTATRFAAYPASLGAEMKITDQTGKVLYEGGHETVLAVQNSAELTVTVTGKPGVKPVTVVNEGKFSLGKFMYYGGLTLFLFPDIYHSRDVEPLGTGVEVTLMPDGKPSPDEPEK